jgi:hypothetical protein
MLRQEAESQLPALLSNDSVAAIYLRHHDNEDEIRDDLHGAFEAAAPILPGRRYSGPEIHLALMPKDEAGQHLGELARSACAEAEVVPVEGADEVLFYRERPQVSFAELPQLGLLAEEVYRQMTAPGQFTPHTRTDISEWLPK